MQLTLQILLDGAAASPEDAAEAAWRPGLETLLEIRLGQRPLDEDGFHMAWLPLARLDFGVVEIGHGHRRRRFYGSLHGGDAVASVMASNKLVIKRQLLRSGVPVPAHRVVENEEQALAAAQAMGWPVVLKPIDQSLGDEVTANLWRVPDLLRAYRKARRVSQKPLLLERHAVGHDHRIVVFDGAVVGALRQRHVTVKGNGFQTLGQLLERARAACTDSREAALYGQDRESRRLMDDQGLSLEEVVESGRLVQVRMEIGPAPFPSNWVDVTDQLHPELAQLAIRAAAALGVRLAGLDVITPDVSQPPLEAGAVVLELNPRPWLRLHRFGLQSRPIDQLVFEAACPAEYRSLPVVLFAGGGGAERLLEALEGALQQQGQVVGCWLDGPEAGAPQVRIASEVVVWKPSEESEEAPGQLVLSDPRLEVALLHLTPRSWQAQGFPSSGCSAGVLTEGEELLERGLLAEWLSVVAGPVVVLAGSGALLEAVRSVVGERLVAAADEAAALEALRALLPA